MLFFLRNDPYWQALRHPFLPHTTADTIISIRPSFSWKMVVEKGNSKHTPPIYPPAMSISGTSAGVGENAPNRGASLNDDEACGDEDNDDDDDIYPAAAVCLLPYARCSSLLLHLSVRGSPTRYTYPTGTGNPFEYHRFCGLS